MMIGVAVGLGVAAWLISGVANTGANVGMGASVGMRASVGSRTGGLLETDESLETDGLPAAESQLLLCRAACVTSLGGMENVGAGVGPVAVGPDGAEAVGSEAVQAERMMPRDNRSRTLRIWFPLAARTF